MICPFNLAIAMGENANVNGVAFKFETEAYDIVKGDGFYTIKTSRGDIQTKAIANAAGVYADKFHNMVSEKKIHITPRKGEYIFFDKSLGTIFNATVVPLPGKMGKGIAASQTIHGNFFVGPTAADVDDKESFQTTQEVLDSLKEIAASPDFLHKNPLPLGKIITSFVGLRAHEDHHEFIVEEVADAENFFDAAGIESPGLTSSPAIGVMLSGIIAEKMQLKKKTNFIARRKGVLKFDSLSNEEKWRSSRKNPNTAILSAAVRWSPRAKSWTPSTVPSAQNPWILSSAEPGLVWAAARQASVRRAPWRFSPESWVLK